MLDTLKTKLSSRKWWAAFIGAIAPIVVGVLSEEVALWESIQASTAVIVSYLFAQGAVDYSAAKS